MPKTVPTPVLRNLHRKKSHRRTQKRQKRAHFQINYATRQASEATLKVKIGDELAKIRLVDEMKSTSDIFLRLKVQFHERARGES